MPLHFRPHHFLCAFCFEGKGYSSTFVTNFQNIMNVLNTPDGDKIPINITHQTDDICAPCPHRQNEHCETEAKIQRLDDGHAQALAINAGETLTWGDAKKRIHEKISLDTFHHICAECEWKALGICERHLTRTVYATSAATKETAST